MANQKPLLKTSVDFDIALNLGPNMTLSSCRCDFPS